MLVQLVWSSVELIATVATLPFPPASFAVGVMLSLHDTVRALQVLRDGDTESACAYILTSILNSLGAAGDLQSGLKGFGGLARKLALPSAPPAHPLQRSVSLPGYEDLYPKRFHDKSFVAAKPGVKAQPTGLATPSASPAANPHVSVAQQPQAASFGMASPSSLEVNTAFEVDLRLHNVPRLTQGHAAGVCLVDGRYYIDVSGKTFEVQYNAQLRHWQIIDPQNPFAFFGKRPVRLDEQGAWRVVDRPGLQGGGLDSPPSYRPLPEDETVASSVSLSDYELPQAYRSHMRTIITGESYNPIDMEPEYFESIFAQVRQKFTALRENLYRDANEFFTAPVLPPRPALPTLETGETLDTFLERLLGHSSGLVLSEAPRSVASKRLLIHNMPLLARERVEVLYVQHLFTDKHLPKLAKYRQLGNKTRSGSHEIKEHLDQLNAGALNNQTTEYDYYHLIKTAHRHGIEVRPLSSSISYPHTLHPVAQAADDATASEKMSNFFSHKIIRDDVAADPTRRWIALVDEKLATTRQQLPGISELEGVPCVHIRDVHGASATRITTGAADTSSASDFTIEFANPLMTTPLLPASTHLDKVLFRKLGKPLDGANPESWAGDYGFRLDPAEGWLRIEPGLWTANNPPTSIQQSLTDARFEIPQAHRATLHHLAHFEKKGLDQHYLLQDAEYTQVRGLFFEARSRLQKEARGIITARLPARPTLPAIEPRTPLPDFLKELYRHTDAVVIGEAHSSVASKQLIIDNLPHLSSQNVRTLYLEHLLTDLNQADLDRFFETGQMSKSLLHDLKTLDLGHRTDANGIYTYEQLVLKTREHGIEVRAIDCAASYHLKGIPGESPTTRLQMMNHFASLTIRKHQQVMGRHKWIALVGNSHSNTYQRLIPGIAELEGGIGVRVKDVPVGHPTGVRYDSGEMVRAGLTTETVHIQGDYLVEMPVQGASRSSLSLPAAHDLRAPGMFLVEESENCVHTIVHRSRDTSIQHTPVLIDSEGKLYVERPSWVNVHLRRFDDMNALVRALEQSNLTLVVWRRGMGSV